MTHTHAPNGFSEKFKKYIEHKYSFHFSSEYSFVQPDSKPPLFVSLLDYEIIQVSSKQQQMIENPFHSMAQCSH